MRAAATGEEMPPRASDDYVRSVFDQFAEHFDKDLRGLGYRIPELIGRAIGQSPEANQQRLIILDAGCGTGLCGVQVRRYAARLDGVDLSPGMIERAAACQVYDHLVVEELMAFMARHENTYDAIVAGDTFNYFGDLIPLLTSAKSALRDGGRLVYSLETGEQSAAECGFHLQPHGRYCHDLTYVRQCSREVGLRVDACDEIVIRKQADEDVEGVLVQASR
jgi:predicted TPR repeat methyltransferase